MNKAVKISLITLLSLLAVLLLSVSVAVWLVFTPSKLTPMVRSQLPKYITCRTELQEAELTFFSTFPDVKVKIKGLKLIHPFPGSPNDTLLAASNAFLSVDIKALVQRNELITQGVELTDVFVNAFVDKSGKPNYDVFVTDTTKKDTAAFENPFKKINIREIKCRNANVSYIDLASDMKASVKKLNANLNLEMVGNQVDAGFKGSSSDVSFYMDSVDYLKKSDVKIEMPVTYEIKKHKLAFRKAELVLNGLTAHATGNVELLANDDVATDIGFSTEPYQLAPLLKMLPSVYTTSIAGMDITGVVSSTGTVKGIYNQKSMPVVRVSARMNDGTYAYNSLPYKLHDIAGSADILIDMNNRAASKILLRNVKAKTDRSEVEASGKIAYILLEDMFFDLNLKMNLDMPELDRMMPDDVKVRFTGLASGTGNVRFWLSDAMNYNIPKMNISGKFDASRLSITYGDSLYLYSDNTKLDIVMPNKKTPTTSFMDATVWCDRLKYHYGSGMDATILNANMKAQTTDLMQTDKLNTMDCVFDFDHLDGNMDGMLAYLDRSKGKMLLKMNFSDSISTPDVVCDFDVSKLKMVVDDSTSAEISYPKGIFKMYGEKNHPAKPVFDIAGTTGRLVANMSSGKVSAQYGQVNTNVVYDENQTNPMLKWLATGDVSLHDGTAAVTGFNSSIIIPTIQLEFSPDKYNIKESRVVIGNSDFYLDGKLWNVDEYFKNKGLLKGDFNFKSKKTDVYQLMAMTSGLGNHDTLSTEVVSKETSTTTSSGPYMVPKGIDIRLHASVDQAMLGFDTARNVLGDLYVKDGILMLEDMRFISSAAKMQITSMYKTPRRNHLYLGLDFHMTDVEISELLKMLPDIDTIMPMLRSFKGKGEFHIAVETYLDSLYNLKKSTLIGAASIRGENLVLMDGETFSEIARTLRFNKKAENKIDSMSAEFTILKKNVDIYPFLIVMDKYKAVVAGKHNLDMNFDYHISVTDSPLPIKFGVNVKGNMDELKNHPLRCIRPAPCRFANLYRPVARKEVDTKKLEIMNMIRKALSTEVIKQ